MFIQQINANYSCLFYFLTHHKDNHALPSYFVPSAELSITLRSYWWPPSSSWHEMPLSLAELEKQHVDIIIDTSIHTLYNINSPSCTQQCPAAETTLLCNTTRTWLSPGKEAKPHLQTLKKNKNIFRTKITLSLPTTTNDSAGKWCLQG